MIKRLEEEINYDELISECLKSGCIDEFYEYNDISNRKLYLNFGIYQEGISWIVKHILRINKEDDSAGIPVDKREPIKLYITSTGGSVDCGFELIDVIQNSTTPVYTVNMGYAYSMGFLILLAGHKRFSMPSAKFLMHDGVNFVHDSNSKVYDQIKFSEKVDDQIKRYVIENSAVTEEEFNSKLRVEWYLLADEAKEKGFIDYIVGRDCNISEVC